MLPTVLRRCSLCGSYFVWLCGFYYRAFRVEFCLALCNRVFLVLFNIVITSLGEDRASWSGCFSCILFVYFARVNFRPFPLPLGVRNWLRFVIVALPGLFY